LTLGEVLPAVAIDEAGNTGPNLLDPDQPVFVLASLDFTQAEAAAILSSLTVPAGRELKFSSLVSSSSGRRNILKLLSSELLSSERVMLSRAHKRYVLAGKLVDLLIEPGLAGRGINAYHGKANIRAAEILIDRGVAACGKLVWSALEERFLAAARAPLEPEVSRFLSALEQARARATDAEVRGLLALVADEPAVVRSLLETPPGSPRGANLDPAIPELVNLLDYWSRRYPRFRVLHDESKVVRGERSALEALHDPGGVKGEFSFGDDRRIMLPGNATEITLCDSRSSPQLQIADILGGACALSALPSRRYEPFRQQLLATGLLDLIVHELWPPSLPDAPRLWDVWSE
jgi:hypothetical protein